MPADGRWDLTGRLKGYMKVSGELHSPVPPGHSPRCPTKMKAGWAPETVGKIWRKGGGTKLLERARIRAPYPHIRACTLELRASIERIQF
jgi:hypothetical protein